MAEQLKTVSLKCSGCGSSLDIEPDVEQFACGYCGTGLLVQRKGGMVHLKPLTAAIAKVQAGTDKTAAELALTRLTQEARALETDRARRIEQTELNIEKLKSNRVVFWASAIVAVFLIPNILIALYPNDTGTPIGLGVPLAFVVAWGVQSWVRDNQEKQFRRLAELDLKPFDQEIAAIREKIAQKQAIVDS